MKSLHAGKMITHAAYTRPQQMWRAILLPALCYVHGIPTCVKYHGARGESISYRNVLLLL